MTVNYRPDLLPFALPKRIGLPYHGLVTNGQLALPVSGTEAHPQPANSDTTLVQHPRSSAPLPDPTHVKYAWKDHAILSGGTHQIGGQQLGGAHWIYCDADYSWRVSWEFSGSGIEQTISVWLEDMFGVFPPKDMTRRKLGEITYTPKYYDGTDQSAAVALWDRQSFVSHSKTGAITIINIGAVAETSQQWNRTTLPINIYPDGITSNEVGFHNAIKIVLSGDGSLVDGSVGSGITAALTMQRDATQMIISESSSYSSTLDDYVCHYMTDILDQGDYRPEKVPCDDPPLPYGADLGAWQYTEYGPKLIDPEEYVWVGSSSSGESTTELAATVKYLDTVKPDGGISVLEITFDASAVLSKSTSTSGALLDDTHQYSAGECVGGVYYQYFTAEVWSGGPYSVTSSVTHVVIYDIAVKWCGATESILLVGTGSGSEEVTGSSLVTDPSPVCPDVDSWTWTVNGSPATAGTVDLYKITNNLLEVTTPATNTLLTILGTKQAVATFISPGRASLNPATGQIATNATLPICWV